MAFHKNPVGVMDDDDDDDGTRMNGLELLGVATTITWT